MRSWLGMIQGAGGGLIHRYGGETCAYICMSGHADLDRTVTLSTSGYLLGQRASPIIMSLPASAIEYQLEHIDDNLQPNIYVACFVCLPAAFVAVALRLWARRMTTGGWGKDDVAILFALLFTSAFVATCIWGKYRIVLLGHQATRLSHRRLTIIQ
jgi:hypothetical protein